MIFFENKLLIQSDVVFDSESNVRNFSSLAPPSGEKKNIFKIFFQNDVISSQNCCDLFQVKIWSDFLKKLIFIDLVAQISAHINVAT